MSISRSSTCQVLCLALAAATVAASLQRAAAFEVNSKSLLTESWDGFDDDYQPDWVGSTKKVSWTLPKAPSYSGSAAGILMVNGVLWGDFKPFVYKPIELSSSSRRVEATAKSSVQDVFTNESYDPGVSSGGVWGDLVARYAEVTDNKGTPLARGSAIGEQRSDLKDDSFFVEGRVSAGAIVESSQLGIAGASAIGKSRLSARYAVREPVNFSLSGTLSGLGALSLDFSLTKDYGESVYQLSPMLSKNGKSWSFDLAGQLEPGSYDFTVSAATDAALGRGTPLDLGGEGEFEVSFAATPVNPYAPPPVAPPTSNQDFILIYAGSAETIDSVPAASTEANLLVPEPQTCAMLLLGMTLLGLRRTSSADATV